MTHTFCYLSPWRRKVDTKYVALFIKSSDKTAVEKFASCIIFLQYGILISSRYCKDDGIKPGKQLFYSSHKYIFLIVNKTISSSKVLLKSHRVAQLLNKLHTLYGNRKFVALYKRTHLTQS